MYIMIFIYLMVGALAGTLSGLLGIGGGLVVVPSLVFLFDRQHFSDPIVMQIAAGTSLAIMMFTTGRSLLAHLSRGVQFWPIYCRLVMGVIIGTIVGAMFAHLLHSDTLKIIFGVVVLLIAIKMIFQVEKHTQRQLPNLWWMNGAGFVIGGKSGLLGIGGGALSIPFLTYFNVSMRQAVVVSVSIGLTVACIGTVSFIITGYFVSGLPRYTIGYVYWPAVITVAIGSVLFAPLGAKLSHYLPVKVLKRIFAVFLIVAGVHMLLSI